METGDIDPALHVQLDAVAALDKASISMLADGGSHRYPAAARSGSFLFTSGISPRGVDALSREADEADLRLLATDRERRIYAQGMRVFEGIERVLALAGARISDVLKVNGWTAFPMREYGAAVLARRRFFDRTQGCMMASTGLAVGGSADADALLTFDAIALVPKESAGPKEVRGPVSSVASPYVAGVVKGGGLLFTSGEIPVRQPMGEVIATCGQLDDAGRYLRFGHIECESGMESRAWFVYRTLEAYLTSFEASFSDVLHQTVFMKNPHLFPVLERIATLFYGRTLPPTTVVPISGTTPLPEAGLEIELIASAR
jgi:enamine deaminase RidA (YjgF/YER057c/UK114 family)